MGARPDPQPGTGEKKRIYEGVPASRGVAIGPAYVMASTVAGIDVYSVSPDQVEDEVARFHSAVKGAREDIERAREQLATQVDESLAQIFDGHLGLLSDPQLVERSEERIREERRNAESVVGEVFDQQAKRIERFNDSKLAGIAADVRDVASRILGRIQQDNPNVCAIKPTDQSIVIAHDLAPSQTAHMAQDRVAGFATDVGGPVSHTALLAKALEIPAVVGLGDIARHIASGTMLIVDGFNGRVILNPTDKEIQEARKQRRDWLKRGSALNRLRTLPAETRDGYLISVGANIELPSEAPHVLEHGADSIGLFRTEFLYLNGNGAPSEDEQYEVYRDVLQKMGDRPVVFRTLDLGGDKFLSDTPMGAELNPFLGLRAIRLCLRYPKIFERQLRAILRASTHGRARIMFPLVSGISQVREAKAILDKVRDQLRNEGVPFDEDMDVGIMIEIPSAALTADILAREVDFFSIGTNDLIQYTLAVDRVNEQVAHLYDPYHPSVLRLIRDVSSAAHRNGIWVGLCGEMASDPDLATLLLGIGIDELSMASGAVPLIKQRVRSLTLEDARQLANEILKLSSSIDVKERVVQRIPEMLDKRSTRARKRRRV